jgi:tol-pal system protein YbgF
VVGAALGAATSVWAQRASLSERIERLEAQAASQNNAQANIETLNRLNALQQEVASLRGLVEQLQNENAQLKQANREQYIDLDSRLVRLEGGSAPVAAAPATSSGAGPGAMAPTAPPASSAAPVDAAPGTVAPTAPRGVVADVATGGAAPPADPAGERPMYDSAFQALRDGEYAEASRRFQAYLEAYPAGTLAPNAWYWLGESYYVTQNYDVALTAFESLLQAFPDSAKAPDALLKLGYCQFELGRAPQGEATLRDVIARFPGSDAARLAQSRLRSLALDAG